MKSSAAITNKMTIVDSCLDSLTGLYNRAGFIEFGNREIERSCRENCPMTLFYIDVHNFAGFNRSYGKKPGDSLLILLGKALRKHCRSTDLLTRLHGDEFVVLFPQMGPQSAMLTLHRLRAYLDRVIRQCSWSVSTRVVAVTFLTTPASIESILKSVEPVVHSLKKHGGGTAHRVITETKEMQK